MSAVVTDLVEIQLSKSFFSFHGNGIVKKIVRGSPDGNWARQPWVGGGARGELLV